MNAREAFRAMVSGCAVYVTMAACGGGEPRGYLVQNSGIGFGTGSGGVGNDSGLLDALVNPVPDALAQDAQVGDAGPAGPQVDDVPCDKTFPGDSANTYAKKDYAGASVIELTRVVALLHEPATSTAGYAQDGYVDYVPAVALRIKAGSAIVACNPLAGPVRFIRW